ncbi:hypothetical protein LEP1GSC170_0755 [Leptospira interrogans serovar Bataviae str. HAI135]|nr:hypothetical protein LEP1GSC170_0755 [Leptospira interrogans serovar Bataviae str. HAI135]
MDRFFLRSGQKWYDLRKEVAGKQRFLKRFHSYSGPMEFLLIYIGPLKAGT